MQQSSIQKVPIPSLLLKKSTASAAAVAAATATTTENNITPTITTTAPTTNEILSTARRCIFDCDNNSVVLCRFPVHDRRRCNNWLKFFKVSPDYIKTHGLLNLRVCLKHFHQQNQMAKTRMKTTPTRLQKDALTAEDIKKRLRQVNSVQPKEMLQVTSSVLVTPPKRTNSISSATSSVSLASDAHSTHSDSEFVGSLSPTKTTVKTPTSIAMSTPLPMAKQQIATKRLNSVLSNQGNIMPLKNRKVFMITERCDELNKETDTAANQNHNNQQISTGQKRKMYLIMEDAPQEQSTTDNGASSEAGETISNKFTDNATKKKLTLFTDNCDAQLTHKFEQILPEILSRINNKVKDQPTAATATTVATTPSTTAIITAKQNGHQEKVTNSVTRAGPQTNDHSSTMIQLEPPREPITLPPKKNRMKIINTSAHSQQSFSAATPVIASATQLINSGKYSMDNKSLIGNIVPLPAQNKNINLSSDFLFLMKMLPKLEAIPEPHKNHVKNCIEKIITQNAALFNE